MSNDKEEFRYFVDSNTTIDLSTVDSIAVIGQSMDEAGRDLGYSYKVRHKSGVTLSLSGVGLRTQFNNYLGVSNDK